MTDPAVLERRVRWYKEHVLNEDQLKAVELLQKESLQPGKFLMPIIEGPPGTGKTTTLAVGIAERLLNLHRKKKEGRYIALCFTHAACEQVKKKLWDLGFGGEKEVDKMDAIHLTPNPYETNLEEGIFGCSSDLSEVEIGTRRWLRRRSVLITTLLGVSRAISIFDGMRIHLSIDEFSQVSSADFFSCLHELRDLKPYQFSLFGDPLQLPVVTTQTHLRPNICSFLNPQGRGTATKGLKIQYRMHDHICEAINEMRKIFHAFPLQSASRVGNRTLEKLEYKWDPPQDPKLRRILDPDHPLVLVDTSALGFEDSIGRLIKFSKEAELATQIAIEASKCFTKNGKSLAPQLLTPYNAQRGLISSLLPLKRGSCTTIYSAQGAEYDAVIISFVRSRPDRFVGFLDDGQLAEQVYVGCSRAKAKLVVLLSFDTFFGGGHRMFQALERAPHAEKVEA